MWWINFISLTVKYELFWWCMKSHNTQYEVEYHTKYGAFISCYLLWSMNFPLLCIECALAITEYRFSSTQYCIWISHYSLFSIYFPLHGLESGFPITYYCINIFHYSVWSMNFPLLNIVYTFLITHCWAYNNPSIQYGVWIVYWVYISHYSVGSMDLFIIKCTFSSIWYGVWMTCY